MREGFPREDLFICVHEQFMTETAAMADIVLPATTFLEHDDIYTAGGHTYLQIARKVVEPYAEARPNHYVICELAAPARRRASRLRHDRAGDHRGDAAALRQPGPAGFDQGRWLDCALPFETAHFLAGFGHAEASSASSRTGPPWASSCELPALPDHAG